MPATLQHLHAPKNLSQFITSLSIGFIIIISIYIAIMFHQSISTNTLNTLYIRATEAEDVADYKTAIMIRQDIQERAATTENLYEIAKLYYLDKNYKQAHVYADLVKKRDGQTAETLLLQGKIATKRQKAHETLLSLFKSAYELDDENQEILFYYSATLGVHDVPQALTILKPIINVEHTFKQIGPLLDIFNMVQTIEDTAYRQTVLGYEFLEIEQPYFAKLALEKSVEQNAEYLDSMYLLAFAEYKLGNMPQAKMVVETALTIDDTHKPSLALLEEIKTIL